jgi:hypothetical protein
VVSGDDATCRQFACGTSAFFLIGCNSTLQGSDSEGACEFIVIHRVDEKQQCFSKTEVTTSMCAFSPDPPLKGMAQICLLSPSGEVFVALVGDGSRIDLAEGWLLEGGATGRCDGVESFVNLVTWQTLCVESDE